jgi:hypothetical protein
LRATSHLPRERRQLGLGVEILGETPGVEQAVVPVIVTDERVRAERISGKRGVHGPDALGLIDAERFAIPPAQELEVLTAAHEVVIERIERKEHSDAAVGLGMQHQQVAVRLRTSVHADTVAPLQVSSLAQPDLYRSLLLNDDGRLGRGHGERREQQCSNHEASRSRPAVRCSNPRELARPFSLPLLAYYQRRGFASSTVVFGKEHSRRYLIAK